MDFVELVERRVSVRQFRPDPVPPQHVREMVRLAGLAPSPNNQQPWRFIAVTRRPLLQEMADAVRSRLRTLLPVAMSEDARRSAQRVEWFSTFFADAPLVMAVTRQPYDSVIARAVAGSSPSGADINAMRGYPDVQSVGAAIEHLLLAATGLGYGTCWLSGPLVARDALEALLGVEAPQQLAALVAIGVPAAPPAGSHDRRPVDEILRFLD
ncbi:MAG: nitroreductase family protein [Vicinamibacterales bacterium]